jgi:hypothetical protein
MPTQHFPLNNMPRLSPEHAICEIRDSAYLHLGFSSSQTCKERPVVVSGPFLFNFPIFPARDLLGLFQWLGLACVTTAFRTCAMTLVVTNSTIAAPSCWQ